MRLLKQQAVFSRSNSASGGEVDSERHHESRQSRRVCHCRIKVERRNKGLLSGGY